MRHLIPTGIKQQIRRWQQQAQARAVLRAPKTTAPMRALLDCALVIPVHNDTKRLMRLLTQARDMGCFAQIVVVDDGSDTPVPNMDDVALIRHETAHGAGVARNAGHDAVHTSHLLFFDSDDLLTAALPDLLSDLAAHPDAFDFCLFKHADSRTVTEGHWGQPDWDEALWSTAGLSIGALQTAPPDTWPTLVRTANYPWNKIYRTAYLRDNAIGCATTPVHEDITLHWLGFLHASDVLVSDRVCAWHLVSTGTSHQSNRSGAERLSVFDALAPVTAASHDNPAMQAALVQFVMDLMIWITDHLDPDQHSALVAAESAWLTGPAAPWRANIAVIDPKLDETIQARLAQ